MTLRKAHKLVKQLEDVKFFNEVKKIHHSASTEDIKRAIKEAETINEKTINNKLLVKELISVIRFAVQNANKQESENLASIDFLLTQKVLIENQMKVLSEFSKISTSSIQTDAEKFLRLQNEVQDTHNSTSDYRENYVNVTGVSESAAKEFNKKYVELKKQQESIIDELSQANNSRTIFIADDYLELLQELQLV